MSEALRMDAVGGIERELAHGAHRIDATEEDVGRGEEGEAGVVMLVVVPAEEAGQPAATVEQQRSSSPARMATSLRTGRDADERSPHQDSMRAGKPQRAKARVLFRVICR